MTMPLQELTAKVNAFINRTHTTLLQAGQPTPQEAITSSLQQLVQEFGTEDYGFNLVMEQYVRYFKDLSFPHLPRILEENRHSEDIIPVVSDDMNVAFAAYYALSLIYKKEGNVQALKELADEMRYPFQRLYPLAYEVQSRYYKRIHEYALALRADEWALRFLKTTNMAVGISYASTVCMMYEEGLEVTAANWEYADRYIDAALNYNPTYSKYHFLRGKLIFYSSRSLRDPAQFRSKCDEAASWIIAAQRLEQPQYGKYTNTALNEYQQVLDRIRDELAQRAANTLPFQPMTEQELQRRIDEILAASDEESCRPPNPKLKPGQKYFFVSYAHADFKAVYCDLLRLYAQKIPFQYDGDLSAGVNWETQVHEYISKPECLGVVFYISKHTPLSEAVEKECYLLKETLNDTKAYFSVNLEGNMAPTEILFQCIRSNDITTLQAKRVDNERMINFLSTFHDKVIYVRKMPADGPASQRHLPSLLAAIDGTFKELECGEQHPVPAGV